MTKLILSMAAVAILITGCASKDVKEQPPAVVEDRKPSVADVKPEVKPEVKPVAKAEPPPVVKPVIERPITASPLTDPSNILSKRSVFFDYDSNVIKDEYKPLVTAHARYLAQNRAARMVIQGNTDERGTREYNLALGQRRA